MRRYRPTHMDECMSTKTALFGEEVVVELERIERSLGHDMWAEEVGREHVQHWDCRRRGCSAVFERRFSDGAVWGSARETACPVPASSDDDEVVLRMLGGAHFGPAAKVVLPSGRTLDGDEAQALTGYYGPTAAR